MPHPDSSQYCLVCGAPIRQPATGRRRRTCSPACRQKLYRRATQGSRQAERARRERAAERQLRAWERIYGPLDQPPADPTIPDLRWRLKFRLIRGIPILHCRACGRPYIHDGEGRASAYCSPACRDRQARRRAALFDALDRFHPDQFDGRVFVRLRLDLPIKLCKFCGRPFPDYWPVQKFCSARCRLLAWRADARPCAECGRSYKPYVRAASSQRYCSAACRQAAANRRTRCQFADDNVPGICGNG